MARPSLAIFRSFLWAHLSPGHTDIVTGKALAMRFRASQAAQPFPARIPALNLHPSCQPARIGGLLSDMPIHVRGCAFHHA